MEFLEDGWIKFLSKGKQRKPSVPNSIAGPFTKFIQSLDLLKPTTKRRDLLCVENLKKNF